MANLNKENIINVAALLVHAAKIDEQYSSHEKNLINEFIKSYLEDDNSEDILIKAFPLSIELLNIRKFLSFFF